MLQTKPANPKGNKPWILIGRTDAEDEAPILWSPDGKNWLVGKDPGAGKDWRQVEKRATENEMVDGITDSMGMNLTSSGRWCRTRKLGGAAVHGVVSIRHNWATEKQQRSRIRNKWDAHSHYIVSSLYYYTSTDCCILLKMWGNRNSYSLMMRVQTVLEGSFGAGGLLQNWANSFHNIHQ